MCTYAVFIIFLAYLDLKELINTIPKGSHISHVPAYSMGVFGHLDIACHLEEWEKKGYEKSNFVCYGTFIIGVIYIVTHVLYPSR